MRDVHGGWSCYVEQGRYGHVAKKATWLYAVDCELPSLRWGHVPDTDARVWVSWCGNNTRGNPRGSRPRVGRDRAARTPDEFRDVLIDMARSVYRVREAA